MFDSSNAFQLNGYLTVWGSVMFYEALINSKSLVRILSKLEEWSEFAQAVITPSTKLATSRPRSHSSAHDWCGTMCFTAVDVGDVFNQEVDVQTVLLAINWAAMTLRIRAVHSTTVISRCLVGSWILSTAAGWTLSLSDVHWQHSAHRAVSRTTRCLCDVESRRAVLTTRRGGDGDRQKPRSTAD